jgi:hypothetical protein
MPDAATEFSGHSCEALNLLGAASMHLHVSLLLGSALLLGGLGCSSERGASRPEDPAGGSAAATAEDGNPAQADDAGDACPFGSPALGQDAQVGRGSPASTCTAATPYFCSYLDQGTDCQGNLLGACSADFEQDGRCDLVTCPTGSTVMPDAGCPPTSRVRCSATWQSFDSPPTCCFSALPSSWGDYDGPAGSLLPGCTLIVTDAGTDAR